MAKTDNPDLLKWVAEVKSDHVATSWTMFGYEGRDTIVPMCKGTGEAEEYWPSFLGMMKNDGVYFSLVRIVMGDSESRRPKFVFVVWLGTKVGMMTKARVGMHKEAVKKFVGDIHMEMQVDCADELEIGAVKTQIKKGMGADYDMGSNSRSADGAQGNEGSAFAPTKYDSQQSSIKANAAAAYAKIENDPNGRAGVGAITGDGGKGLPPPVEEAKAAAVVTMYVPGAAAATPAPAAAAAPVKVAAAPKPKSEFGRFVCVKKSQLRAGSAMESDKTEVMNKATEFDALEPPVRLMTGAERVHSEQGWVSMHTGAGATCLVQLYTCVKKSQLRAGAAMDSDKAAILNKGSVVQVQARETNEAGVIRCHLVVAGGGGWVSMVAGNGAQILEAC